MTNTFQTHGSRLMNDIKVDEIYARSNSPDHQAKNAYYEIALTLLETESFLSLNKLAKTLGCSYYTVRGWWRTDPTFKALFLDARQRAVDEIKEHSFGRAQGLDGEKPSDLMAIYIMNNFDEEIVERTTKNRGAEITIHIDVPSQPQTVEGWVKSVQDIPASDYKALPAPDP